MQTRRATRIVSTLGPASGSPEMIRKLVMAGADVFRLNFSHGKHEEHGARLAAIRALEAEIGRPITVVADMQGPKLRIGTFADGPINIAAGDKLRLDLDPTPGNQTRVCLPHPEIFAAMKPGRTLLLDDGRVRLKVDACGADFAETTVINGTKLSERKGVNVPDCVLGLDALTEKDRRDLAFALDQKVDYIALSFVQRPEDVAEARKIIGDRAGIISKIEKPSAVEHLAEIIELSDALMVARGDLGVEMMPEDVPGIQKKMVRMCRDAGKPVIVATQMLESMISAPTPTRAEASDVANAVFDGADAVMLSGETAAGDYPVEAITIMDRICRKVENDPHYRAIMAAQNLSHDPSGSDAITAAAKQVATTVGAATIVAYTTSGCTVYRASRERPAVPVLCLAPSMVTARRVTLAYGVVAELVPDLKTFEETVPFATRVAEAKGLATKGQSIVITAGVPFGTPGTTNTLRIAKID